MKQNDPGVRRLVNAVLVPGFVGTTVPAWLARELEDGLGGVCWFAHNVETRDATRDLADAIHRLGEHALIWCDEEGGAVSRLDAQSGSPWPGHAALGQLDDVHATRSVGLGIGTSARESGIDIVLAPVVDVNSDPDNPVIGVRSFGGTPDLVARHGTAFAAGLQVAGVAACAKHFPGHGATAVDSHLEAPVVDAARDVLWQRELAPFVAAVESGVRCLLTAHVVFPAVDSELATMSSTWMRMLREDLGFDGVVGTDALDMKAISAGVGRGEGAVRALAAGVDAACIGNPAFPETYDDAEIFEHVRAAVLGAVDDGRLGMARLEEAAGRLAELAAWTRRTEAFPEAPQDGLDIARRSLAVDGDVAVTGAPLVLMHQAGSMAAGDVRFPLARFLGAERDGTAYETVRSGADAVGAMKRHPGQAVVVVTDGLAGGGVVEAVRSADIDAVVVHNGPVGTARDLAAPLIRTWGGGAASARAAAEYLLAEQLLGGRNG
ncbi:glycoside hydrolase family 3 N-terminal domain-containing protein [Solicola gregarius]|uniref:Glycoside hydrolase n=1 Tax=Solicola gregarius TaxID=2908642 RepID=A0AA46YJD9_9ACTN|nr:glycoside hydrolase family 3 N-terminal domain-containing protein [Solicola gregarius]UYM03464.1 glycoside hydrolase [Solicola gregarius]